MDGRIIILGPVGVAEYMALSQTIQESVGDGYPTTVLLSPGWEQKGLSIGKAQNIGYVNLEACNEDHIQVVRRPTEGYAVIHYTDDVAYSIAVSREYIRHLSKRGFDELILPILVRSLERIGVPDGYDPFPERYGNLFVNGKKISGSAQHTNRKAWLQHGTIAVRIHEPNDYIRYLNVDGDVARIKSQMTSVEEEMGIPNPDNLVRVLDEEFRSLSQFGIDLEQSSLSPEELGYAEELVRTKYTNKEWLKSRKKDESGRTGCFIWKID